MTETKTTNTQTPWELRLLATMFGNEILSKPIDEEKLKKIKRLMAGILFELDPKEETVIRMHFGALTNAPKTLEEVGELLGVTRERVREIEEKALNRLKHPERARRIRSFLED